MGPGVLPDHELCQSSREEVPAFFVHRGGLAVRQPGVAQMQERARAVGLKRELHGRRARRQGVVPLPSPREDDPARGFDLNELTSCDGAGRVHPHAIHTARTRVKLGLDPLPTHVAFWFDQVREHGLGGRLEMEADLHLVRRDLRRVSHRSSSRMTSRSRERSRLHICSSTSASGPAASRSAR